MTPYYEQDGITIYHGDCAEIMLNMSSGGMLVSAVICDPPYAIEFTGQSFADTAVDPVEKSWASRGLKMVQKPHTTPTLYKRINPRCAQCGRAVNGVSTAKGFKVCECGGSDLAPWPNSAMVRLHEWHMSWALQGFWLLAPGGWLVAFASTRTVGRLTCALEDSGFEIRDQIAWRHDAGIGRNDETLRTAYEPAVIARKPSRPADNRIALNAPYETNVINCSKAGQDERWGHPTPKPEALMVSICGMFGGEVTLDPFMGSGTTLVAAKRLGRKAIGIELSEAYCEIAAKRLAQGALPLEFSA